MSYLSHHFPWIPVQSSGLQAMHHIEWCHAPWSTHVSAMYHEALNDMSLQLTMKHVLQYEASVPWLRNAVLQSFVPNRQLGYISPGIKYGNALLFHQSICTLSLSVLVSWWYVCCVLVFLVHSSVSYTLPSSYAAPYLLACWLRNISTCFFILENNKASDSWK